MPKQSKRIGCLAGGILYVIGALLLVKALLGMFGIWQDFLPLLSEPLQESWQCVLGVMLGGGLCLFIGFDLLRKRK